MTDLRDRLLHIVVGSDTRAALIRLMDDGADRQAIVDTLHQLEREHAGPEDEALQDKIKDALDLLYGWCAPDARL